ncbi:MAG TPA: GatB/YqeY domain-containing protein [Solirubrobacteraceae bacterium]
MTVLEQLKSDLTTAMKAGERERVGALRMVISELQKDSKEGSGDELAVLRRERKRRLEAAEAYREAGRQQLADGEEAEAQLISSYLPTELSDAELQEIVAGAVRESGAESIRDMGRAMGVAMTAVDGRADGKRVSALVRVSLGG